MAVNRQSDLMQKLGNIARDEGALLHVVDKRKMLRATLFLQKQAAKTLFALS